MKLQIRRLSETRSINGKRDITVFADTENTFEIEVVDENGIPGKKENRAELLNMKEGEKIKWVWFDEERETVLFEKETPVTEQFSCTITKKLSGSYYYLLKASITGRIDQVDAFRINGYCEPKILKTEIQSDKDGDICFGNIITVLAEAEGLNGNNVKVEIYNEKEICVGNWSTKCHEGDIRREGFDTLGWQSKCKEPGKEEPEAYTFKVRIKDREEYVKDAGGNIDVYEFKIKNKNDTPGASVDNMMIHQINDDQDDQSEEPEQVGVLAVESALVKTAYTVTNDEVNKENKELDHWILTDGNKKKCHWAKRRYRKIVTEETLKAETEEKERSIDKLIRNNGYKPRDLPVMLPSTKKMFEITVWFKVIIPFDSVEISLTPEKEANDQEVVKYTFEEQTKKGGKKDQLFKLTFKCKNPYMNQVQYFKKVQLKAAYLLDGDPWKAMDTICFELYITWKPPISGLTKEIPETLLRLACEYAGNQSTEADIVEKVFKSFDQKREGGVPRIYRVREVANHTNRPNDVPYLTGNLFVDDSQGKETGMGYWRGISHELANPHKRKEAGEELTLSETIMLDKEAKEEKKAKSKGETVAKVDDEFFDRDKQKYIIRPLSTNTIESTIQAGLFLLKHGEARCGEWAELFLCTLYVHRISSCEVIHIFTDAGKAYGISAEDTTYKKSEDHITDVKSFFFAVRYAKLSKVSKGGDGSPIHELFEKDSEYYSIAQGNSNARRVFLDHIWCYYPGEKKFYDTSYAVQCEATIKTYCSEFLTNLSYELNGEYHLANDNLHKYIFASNNNLFE